MIQEKVLGEFMKPGDMRKLGPSRFDSKPLNFFNAPAVASGTGSGG